MNAAKTGSLEGIEMLLKAGADPNKEDSEGMTALAYAIVSGNIEIINKLAPVTTTGVDQIIIKLAQSSLNIEVELEKYLKNIEKKKIDFLLKSHQCMAMTNCLIIFSTIPSKSGLKMRSKLL